MFDVMAHIFYIFTIVILISSNRQRKWLTDFGYFMYFTPICYISIVATNICGKNLLLSSPIVTAKMQRGNLETCKRCWCWCWYTTYCILHWNGHFYVSQQRHRNGWSQRSIIMSHCILQETLPAYTTETTAYNRYQDLISYIISVLTENISIENEVQSSDLYGWDDSAGERGRFYSNRTLNTTCNITSLLLTFYLRERENQKAFSFIQFS